MNLKFFFLGTFVILDARFKPEFTKKKFKCLSDKIFVCIDIFYLRTMNLEKFWYWISVLQLTLYHP